MVEIRNKYIGLKDAGQNRSNFLMKSEFDPSELSAGSYAEEVNKREYIAKGVPGVGPRNSSLSFLPYKVCFDHVSFHYFLIM